VKIKGIAFDLEGPLVDVESAHHQGHILSAADVGLKMTNEDCLKLPHFIGGPDTEVAKEIAQLAGGAADADFVYNRKKFHYDELIKTLPIRLRPGVTNIFEEIMEENLKIAVGSLTIKAQATLLLEKTGLYGIFGKNILLREDVRNVKPDPEVFLKTAEIMGIRPEEQLVFEDSPNGIIAAKAAGSIAVGMPTIHVPITIKKLIDAGAVRIFWDWREINFQSLIKNLNQI